MKSLNHVKVDRSKQSWVLSSDCVECVITQLGGQIAPVTFLKKSTYPIKPYYISPWQEEDIELDEPVLRPLRGDFFCMPFGANPSWNGEKHRVHGEVAYDRWKKEDLIETPQMSMLTLSLFPKIRPGKVIKRIALRKGENVIYQQHEISGISGPMPLGHHAIIAAPQKGDLRISSSPFKFGETSPRPSLYYSEKEYYSLAPQERFTTLKQVPTIWKDDPFTDVTVFPARKGFVDVLSIYADDSVRTAWVCAAAPEAGYLWFALKDASVLPATTLWMENQGRHGEPWSGRNCCIGIEDVCSYHAEGLKGSVEPNSVSRSGVPTAVNLSAEHPTFVNYIQGVVQIPKAFDRVQNIEFLDNKLRFTSVSQKYVEASVNHAFIYTGSFSN